MSRFRSGLFKDQRSYNIYHPPTVSLPPNIYRVQPSDSCATVYFSPPDRDGHSPIQYYQYSYKKTDTETYTETDINPNPEYPDSTYSGPFKIPIGSFGYNFQIKINGLENDINYTFVIQAVNGIGASKGAYTNASPFPLPGQPINIELTTVSDRVIILTWTEGSTTNNINGYSYSIESDSIVSKYIDIDTNPYRIINLINGKTYTINLRARNINGWGESASVVRTPYTPAYAPTITVYGKDKKLQIEFVEGYNGGRPITGYNYTCNSISTYTDQIKSPLVIDNLDNGTSYAITMQPINDNGAGIISSIVTGTPYTNPDPPTNLIFTPRNGHIDISFVAPLITGGGTIHHYNYYSTSSSSSTLISGSIPIPSGQMQIITIAGLTNGTSYTFHLQTVTTVTTFTTVTAHTDYSNSIDSSYVTITPYTTPSSPDAITIENIADGKSVIVNFTAPDNGGDAIQYYEYSVTIFTTTDTTTTGTTSTVPFTITDLVNKTLYQLYIYAINSGGSGGIGGKSFTTLGKPGAPIINVIPGDKSFDIHFTLSDNGGSDITGYICNYTYDTVYNSLNTTQLTTPIPISGLINGQQYRVSLSAINFCGQGPFSDICLCTPSTAPDAPIITSCNYDDASINVYFIQPLTGGLAISNYKYTCTSYTCYFDPYNPDNYNMTHSIDSSFTKVLLPVDNVSPITIDLSNGTTYTIQLKAIDILDRTGSSSSDSSFVTPTSVPLPPTNFNYVFHYNTLNINDSSATILFTPSTSPGAIYYYSNRLSNGSNYVTNQNQNYVITGLVNGTSYDISLQAINVNQQHSTDLLGTVFTPPGAPILTSTYITGHTDISCTMTDSQFRTDYSYNYYLNGSTIYSGPDASRNILLIIGNINDISVNVTNHIGTGPMTNISQGTVPGTPLSFRSNYLGDISFIVTDTQPMTDYSYNYNLNHASYVKFFPTTTTATNAIYTSNIQLVAGKVNDISINMTNYLGTGITVDLSQGTVPGIPFPSSRHIYDATTHIGSADISFNMTDTQSIADYSYNYIVNGTTNTYRESNKIFTLLSGQLNDISVNATNQFGTGLTAHITQRTVPGIPFPSSRYIYSNTHIGSADISFNMTDTQSILDYSYNYIINGITNTDLSSNKIFTLLSGRINDISVNVTNIFGTGLTAHITQGSVPGIPHPGSRYIYDATTHIGSADISFNMTDTQYIADYSYNYIINGTTDTDLSSNKIFPLLSGQLNDISVNVTNGFGTGLTAHITQGTVPGMPLLTSTYSYNTEINNGTTDISCTMTDTQPMTDYSYNYIVNGQLNTYLTPKNNFILIPGITNDISVNVTNQFGTGLTAHITQNTIPSAVTDLSYNYHTTANSFVLSFHTIDTQTIDTSYCYNITTATSTNNNYTFLVDKSSWIPHFNFIISSSLLAGQLNTITVKAHNIYGYSDTSFIITRTLPGQMTFILVTYPDYRDISFSMQDTQDRTDYEYEYRLSTADSYTEFTCPYTIPGLLDGTTYTIYLRASNYYGSGSISSSTMYTVPSTPVISLSSYDAISGYPNINYSTTTGSGYSSTISSYDWSANDTSISILKTISSSIISSTNGTFLMNDLSLNLCKTYSFALSARNSIGPSQWSNTITFTPILNSPTATITYSPARLHTSQPNNSPGSTRDDAILNYSVEYPSTHIITDTNDTNSIDICNNELTFGSSSDIKLRANNAYGSSTPKPYTIYTKPTAPYNLLTSYTKTDANINSDMGQIDISFSMQDTQNNYEYDISNNINNTIYQFSNPGSCSGTGTFHTALDVIDGYSYTITVDASNVAGHDSSYITQNTPPGVITLVSNRYNNSDIKYSDISINIAGNQPINNYIYSYTTSTAWTSSTTTGTTGFTTSSTSTSNIAYKQVPLTLGVGPYTININVRDPNFSITKSINVIQNTPPNKPIIISNYTGGFAHITYTDPSNGGSPITGFDCSINDHPKTIYDTTCIIDSFFGLVAGNKYQLQIDVFNEIGYSAYSDAVYIYTKPAKPVINPITISDYIGGFAHITYTVLNDNNGLFPITGFDCSINDHPKTIYDTTCIIDSFFGLVAGNKYQLQIDVSNAIGYSVYSDPIDIYTTPTAPISITGTTLSAITITQSTTTPTTAVLNVTGYYVAYLSSSNYIKSNLIDYTSNSALYSVTFNPILTAGTTYTLYVQSYNPAGVSTWSTTVTTLYTTPTAPISITGTLSAITVNTDSNVTGYYFAYTTTTSFNGDSNAESALIYSIGIGGVGPYNPSTLFTVAPTTGTYNIFAKAYNPAGVSNWSTNYANVTFNNITLNNFKQAQYNTTGHKLYYISNVSDNANSILTNNVSGTITILVPTTIYVLLIGGGGCGGPYATTNGGGQGGNGIYAELHLPADTYTITINTGKSVYTNSSSVTYGKGGSDVIFNSSMNDISFTAFGGSGGIKNHSSGYTDNSSNGLTGPTKIPPSTTIAPKYYYAIGSNGQSTSSYAQNGYVIIPETVTVSSIGSITTKTHTNTTNTLSYNTGKLSGLTTEGTYITYNNYFNVSYTTVQNNYYYLPINQNMFNDISNNCTLYNTYFQIGFGSGGTDSINNPGYSDRYGFVYAGGRNATSRGQTLAAPTATTAFKAAGPLYYSIGCGGWGGNNTLTDGPPGGPAIMYLYI